MATEDLKSSAVTNMDAKPRVPVNGRLNGGHVRIAKAKIETLLAASLATGTYRFVRVPQIAMVHAVFAATDAMGGSGAADIGVFIPGGAVVDADLFASALAVSSAVVRTDVTHESGQYNVDECEKPLWSVLGHTIDDYPDGYDIGMTVETAFASLGTMMLEVWYTI